MKIAGSILKYFLYYVARRSNVTANTILNSYVVVYMSDHCKSSVQFLLSILHFYVNI